VASARNEAPKAPMGEVWGGGVPYPLGYGSGVFPIFFDF